VKPKYRQAYGTEDIHQHQAVHVGSSEAHNKRTAEYLANIRKEKFYIRTDLMAKRGMGIT